VPPGAHKLSLYFFNKDGHKSNNRQRDYLIKVQKVGGKTIARTRVTSFWGGVYKQFVIQGGGVFLVNIGRNYSFNTICSGVFIDRLTGRSDPTDHLAPPWCGDVRYERPHVGNPQNYRQLMDVWDAANPVSSIQSNLVRIEAYRMVQETHAASDLLAAWRWDLHLWNSKSHQVFQLTMREAYQSLCKNCPSIATAH
jgi:hypothetical protein